MPRVVVDGAQLMCSFGTTPSTLAVLPKHGASSTTKAATIMDHVPIVNIGAFGMCTSIANPQVASATSAALGVLTPQPCLPCTAAPWSPGSPDSTINDEKVLNDISKLQCNWAGVITIIYAGQNTAEVS